MFSLKRHIIFGFLPLILLYLVILIPFTEAMKTKPVIEKVGYVPEAEAVKIATADQRELTAAFLVMKVMFYYGGLIDMSMKKINIPADYSSMYKFLSTALKIDPYNLDAYYFAQAVFAWDSQHVREANALLEEGVKYRTWDWYLPFSAGFNYAYFLKDYDKAASYFRRAAELTGNELSINLTGRYLYQAGKTEMAIAYMETMLKTVTNESIRKTFKTRLAALKAVLAIERARDAFRVKFGILPGSIAQLQQSAFLPVVPEDPYGGKFFLEIDGKVSTTSKLSFGVKTK